MLVEDRLAASVRQKLEGTESTSEAAVEALTTLIAARFRYEKGATTVHSDVAEVLALRAGVCQDFAHVMIACCRLLGTPARYVSGYVYEGEDATHESHAWVEAWFPGVGWRGFDPTHPVRAGDRHVKVAVGRDYMDCAPTRGVYVGGGATSTMEACVTVSAG
jgi:transglutaminase-like putative cysteine protease